MNNTHKLILVKKDNTLHLIPPETCKNISTIPILNQTTTQVP
jgi:hypothetical protein